MPDKWRLDSPRSDAANAMAALTPAQMLDCSVEVRSKPADADGPESVWVEVYSPRGAVVPVVSVELPGDEMAMKVARLHVLNLLHHLAAVASGERYVA